MMEEEKYENCSEDNFVRKGCLKEEESFEGEKTNARTRLLRS